MTPRRAQNFQNSILKNIMNTMKAPVFSIATHKVGEVSIPLARLPEPQKVADFLTSAADAEVIRANFKLNTEMVMLMNQQYAAQLNFLQNTVEAQAKSLRDLTDRLRDAENLQQYPILSITPDQALQELTQSLGRDCDSVDLMEWIFQHRRRGGDAPTTWKDIAQGIVSFVTTFPNTDR